MRIICFKNRKHSGRIAAFAVLTILFSFLFLAFPMSVFAENASVNFGSGQYEVEKGDNFPIGVYIKTDLGASSYSVIIRYDPKLLAYVEGADGADVINGAVQLVGSGTSTSIRRMIRFQAVGTGNAGVYAESAMIYYIPMLTSADAAGNEVSVPAGDPIVYNITGLAMAPVIITEPGADITDEQTDNSEAEPAVVGADNDHSEDAEALQLAEPVPSGDPVSDTGNGTDADGTPDQNTDTASPEAFLTEGGSNIWASDPAPAFEEKNGTKAYNSILVAIVAIIVIVAWIDFVVIFSRKSEAVKRRKEEARLEKEEKELDSDLRFAEIDDTDVIDLNNPEAFEDGGESGTDSEEKSVSEETPDAEDGGNEPEDPVKQDFDAEIN